MRQQFKELAFHMEYSKAHTKTASDKVFVSYRHYGIIKIKKMRGLFETSFCD